MLYFKTTTAHTADPVAYVTVNGSNTNLEMLETLFAGLSVLIGGLALITGLLQLRWYWRRHASSSASEHFEMEAALPRVSSQNRLMQIHD